MNKPTHRRHDWRHDYCERGVYHITLVCSDRARLLGRIVGDSPATARCELSPLGTEVSREIGLIAERCGTKGLKVKLLAKVVMPDHVHNNPRHRWLRSRHRDLLFPTRGIVIAGRRFDGIGNVGLLARERRRQVWVRSRWDVATRRDYMNRCIAEAREGAVLVSPFISPNEAAVRDAALKEGLAVIVVVGNGFADMAQCPGGLYDFCLRGQVLVLAPGEAEQGDRRERISRTECVALNSLAADVADEAPEITELSLPEKSLLQK